MNTSQSKIIKVLVFSFDIYKIVFYLKLFLRTEIFYEDEKFELENINLK